MAAMTLHARSSAVVAACLSALLAGGQAQAAIEVLVAQSPAPPPGAPTAAVYVSLRNTGKLADQLLGASTPVAGMAMIHSEKLEGGIMRMQAEPALPVAPGATLAMHAGGTHVMLMDLKRPLLAGQRFPIVLHLARAGEVRAEVLVLPLGSRP
jgi:periplasmic copper chaperone A